MLRSAATVEPRGALGADAGRRLPERRTAAAEQALDDYGIAFTLYSKSQCGGPHLPFDAIPRVLAAAEWNSASTCSRYP